MVQERKAKVQHEVEILSDKKQKLQELLSREKSLNNFLIEIQDNITGSKYFVRNSKKPLSAKKHINHMSSNHSKRSIEKPKFNVSYTGYYLKKKPPNFHDYVEFKQDLNDWNRRVKMLKRYEVKMSKFNDGTMDSMLVKT